MNWARWAEDKKLEQEKDRDTSKQDDGGNADGLQPVSVVVAAAGDGDDVDDDDDGGGGGDNSHH